MKLKAGIVLMICGTRRRRIQEVLLAFHLSVLSVVWLAVDLQLNKLLVLPSVLDGRESVVIQ